MRNTLMTIVFCSLLSLRLSAADFKFIRLDVPGASTTVPKGINALGDVVGLTVDGDGNGHGFLFHQGKFNIIDVPNSSFTNAVGINAYGDIVGRFSDLDGNNHGYLLRGGISRRLTSRAATPTPRPME